MRTTNGIFFAVVAAAGLSAGCLSELIPSHQQTQSGTGMGQDPAPTPADDAGTPPTDDAGPPGDGGASDLLDCIPKSAQVLDGHHNAGQDCLTCHNGTAAPKFYVAGTLFSAATGGAGVGQATIELTDANNKVIPIVTAAQTALGNFWYDQPVAFPVKVRASSCPDTQAMSAQVDQTGGSCNSCHNAQMQIHLP
jgi:hypothetical protein